MKDAKINNYYKIEDIYTDGEVYLRAVLASIREAKNSIEFETYIFESCQIGETILIELQKAVLRGIKVRLLVDGVGSRPALSWLMDKCSQYQIEFKVFHPIDRWFRFFHWNKRNHRKTVIIDKFVAYVGSINIAKVHFASEVKNPWQDLALKASGDSVAILQAAFTKTWEDHPEQNKNLFRLVNHRLPIAFIRKLRTTKWRVNNYLILRFFFWRDLLRRIRYAKVRIWIMNAYFIPHRTLLRSLVKAAKSGAVVKIILPGQSDVPITKWATPALYYYLLSRKIRIFEFSKTMLHTKTVLIDNWGLIGSHNLNYRSLIHDLEVEAVVQESEYLKKMEDFYLHIMSEAKEITLLDIANLSWWDWIKCRFIMLFKYLL